MVVKFLLKCRTVQDRRFYYPVEESLSFLLFKISRYLKLDHQVIIHSFQKNMRLDQTFFCKVQNNTGYVWLESGLSGKSFHIQTASLGMRTTSQGKGKGQVGSSCDTGWAGEAVQLQNNLEEQSAMLCISEPFIPRPLFPLEKLVVCQSVGFVQAKCKVACRQFYGVGPSLVSQKVEN